MRMVRFMDDLVIMCATHEEAVRALDLARRQLAVLRLQLNAEKTRVTAYADGLEFLGQALAPRQRWPRPGQGLASFEEAERALRDASRQARMRTRARVEQVRQAATGLRRRVQGEK
jgi:hypothetical protein